MLKRLLSIAIIASIVALVARVMATNRERLAEVSKDAFARRPTFDQPGPPPVAPGRYAPDVEFEGGKQDELTTIKGIGPASEEQLKAAGITTFEKLADLTGEQVLQVLTSAPPGADFDSWVAQARELAEGRRSST
ncbi:MAG TPA: helix-hairpin-helix domain-containing protein [Dehalococcoidia bacterium]|nr:helix-hairpin-helix domain-containing protein [Dehalococcoidia bacterium]